MDLLRTLGVDQTFWYQLALLIAVFIALSKLVIGPYMHAIDQRKQRTLGSEELAANMLAKTEQIQREYETRAQQINMQIREVYDSVRVAARKEQEAVIQSTRAEVETYLRTEREKLKKNEDKVRAELAGAPADLATTISAQLMPEGGR